MHLPAKTKLLWYELDKVLGQGGFGTTYFARDVNLKQSVAVKEFFPFDFASRTGDLKVKAHDDKKEFFSQYRERFLQEAQTLASFSHPNIVKVRTAFKANDTAYMVMDYEQGEVLKSFAKRNKLTEAHIKSIFIPVIEGLEAVHSRNFIHRDIKPDNILIRKDRSPVLLDFGSARTSAAEFTESVTILVSPGYAPIEQFHSDATKQGPWTDIYGLAASMYFCITGHAPPSAQQRFTPGKAYSLQEDPVQPLSSFATTRGFSQSFLRAIDKGLSFYSTQRPQDLNEWKKLLLADDLPTKRPKRPSASNTTPTQKPSNANFAVRPTSPSHTTKPKQHPQKHHFLNSDPSAGKAKHQLSSNPIFKAGSSITSSQTASGSISTPISEKKSNTGTVKVYTGNRPKKKKIQPQANTKQPNGKTASKPNTTAKTQTNSTNRPKSPSAIYDTNAQSKGSQVRKYILAGGAAICCVSLVYLAIKAAFLVIPKAPKSSISDISTNYEPSTTNTTSSSTSHNGTIESETSTRVYQANKGLTNPIPKREGYDSLSSATTKNWISRYQGNAAHTDSTGTDIDNTEESISDSQLELTDTADKQDTTDLDTTINDTTINDTTVNDSTVEDISGADADDATQDKMANAEDQDLDETSNVTVEQPDLALSESKPVEKKIPLPPLTNKDLATKAKEFQTIFQTFHSSALHRYFDVSEKNTILFKSLSKAYTSSDLALVPRGAKIDPKTSTGTVTFEITSLYTDDGVTVKPSSRWSTIQLEIRKDRYGFIHSQWL